MRPISKLTAKQKMFSDEYVKSGNIYQSAIKAGYSESYAKGNAAKLLENVSVKAYISAKMKEIESHRIADAKEVLQFYTRVMRGKEKQKIPMATAKEVVMVEVEPDFKDKLAAAKELIKRYPVGPAEEAKLKSLSAKARIDESKAIIAERLGSEDNEQLDEILDKLVKEVNNESKSTSDKKATRGTG